MFSRLYFTQARRIFIMNPIAKIPEKEGILRGCELRLGPLGVHRMSLCYFKGCIECLKVILN